MIDVLHLDLQSCTVFWEELGMLSHRAQTAEYRAKAASWWDAEVAPWISQHIQGHYNPHEAGVWFAERRDAMLFKLTWAGVSL